MIAIVSGHLTPACRWLSTSHMLSQGFLPAGHSSIPTCQVKDRVGEVKESASGHITGELGTWNHTRDPWPQDLCHKLLLLYQHSSDISILP